jgi:hypothetical protein
VHPCAQAGERALDEERLLAVQEVAAAEGGAVDRRERAIDVGGGVAARGAQKPSIDWT